MGIFLFIAGLTRLWFRSSSVIPWRFLALGICMILTAGLSLLPARGPLLPWRAALHQLNGLYLSEAVSLDPWSTLFWLLLLAATFFIALFLLSNPLGPRDLSKVGCVTVLGCTVYAALSWWTYRSGWHYPFFHPLEGYPEVFGFFPNRNHTAGFLVTGAILCLGMVHTLLARGNVAGGLGFFFCFSLLSASLLVFSHSRAGLLFLLIGVAIWLVGLGAHRSRLLVVASAVIAACLALLFLGSGSDLLQRIKGLQRPGSAEGGSLEKGVGSLVLRGLSDARIPIALDTFRMVEDHPLSGIGLGGYSLVYPFYAEKSIRGKTTALHPEDDWLMMATEGGLPFLIIVFALVVMLLWGIPDLCKRYDDCWPIKWAFVSAFLAELLHGFVDVPLHKVELGWWVLVLGGVGFSGIGKGAREGAGLRFQRVLLGTAGFLILAGGVDILLGYAGKTKAIPPFESRDARLKLIKRYAYLKPEERGVIFKECERLLSLYPMNGQLHYQYGIFLLQEHRPAEAASEFGIARKISPWDSDLAFEQGGLMAGTDPAEASRIWKEALQTRLRIDRHDGEPIARTPELFMSMTSIAASYPELIAMMSGLSALSPELRMIWLSCPQSDPAQFASSSTDTTFMGALSQREQGRFFELWWQRGDKKQVESFLEAHPEYSRAAISTRSAIAAASGREEEACKSLISMFNIDLPPIANSTSLIKAAESDAPSETLAAAKYYLERGNFVAGRRLLLEASSDPNNTREILLLKGRMELSSKNWKDLLNDLLHYLHATGQL